jgi:hypothetical protein
MQVLLVVLPHIAWIRVLMWVLYFAPTWDYKSIISVFTLIQIMNILGYAQHGGTTIMD